MAEITYLLCDKCKTQITRKDTPSPDYFELMNIFMTNDFKIICRACGEEIIAMADFIGVLLDVHEPIVPPDPIKPGRIVVRDWKVNDG